MKNFYPLALLGLLMAVFHASSSQAFEMLGLVGYDFGTYPHPLANQVSTQNGLGYAFFGRLDLGPGKIESGFIYTPTSITTETPSQSFEIKTAGSYWLIPVLYRYSFYEPFLSLGIGFDYAFVGFTAVSVSGTPFNNPDTTGYQNNFGAEISLEANQDIGENLSIALDLRYRKGLQDAISFDNTSSKFNFVMLGLGLMKRL